ncbi:uncharacterized protein LOC130796962 [Amaranthus tricolor]|uniref:uncharacterized protein LOC130796962 n=1 Tax=Amaranthus tricolor TaxID=29722 RepID=UPI00259030BB|nr:uncharacterized protein LOC130796962 [Amaranthus tricolor]
MALSIKQMALLTSFFGICSFICGVIAENKKPATGTPIPGKGVVICKYPSDPTVVLGYISFGALLICTTSGYMSVFYPYNKKAIPFGALFRSKALLVFFNIAWITAGLAAALLIWPTITEQFHLSQTVHRNLNYSCPTAKTGVLGGGAFVSLDSCLFWLICLMLTNNVREDYFEEVEGPRKGEIINDDENTLVSEALKHASIA